MATAMVLVETNMGNFTVELDEAKTPNTCSNFLRYVRDGYYENTIFHRVIDGFMIQGGGFDTDMLQKTTRDPIENEADLGGQNVRGTVAMARTSDPHSATSQFFINLKDNAFLDYRAKDPTNWGYCVFGRVVNGMEVVDKIAKLPTTTRAGHGDVPCEDVIVKKVEVTDMGTLQDFKV